MIAVSPDKLADKLIDTYAHVGAKNKRIQETLTAVLTQFRAHGIDCILLKGADVLSRLYGVWGIRPMADADLLVREQDLPAIDRILVDLGYRQVIDGNPAYVASDGLLILDLVPEVWYMDTVDAVWQRAIERTLAGHSVKCMGAEDLLLYLIAYSVLHRGYFTPFFSKDIALLVGKEALGWEFILSEALRWNLKIPLYHGLSYASRHEFIPIPNHVLESLVPANRMERVLLAALQQLVTDQPMDNLGHLLMLIALPWDMKWRRLRQIFWPSTAFLNYRYGERGASEPLRMRLARALHLTIQAQRLIVRILYRLARQH